MLALTATLFVLGGCVKTLSPIYTWETVVQDDGLIGKWCQDDGKQTWEFSEAKSASRDASIKESYFLTITDKDGKEGNFHVHLTEIGGQRFLDLFPRPPSDIDASDFYKYHLQFVHTFFRCQRDGDELEVTAMDVQWLERYLKSNPDSLSHHFVSNNGFPTQEQRAPRAQLVVTAGTEQLRSFLSEHATSKQAFPKPSQLSRCQ
jgi:hypothetical protein